MDWSNDKSNPPSSGQPGPTRCQITRLTRIEYDPSENDVFTLRWTYVPFASFGPLGPGDLLDIAVFQITGHLERKTSSSLVLKLHKNTLDKEESSAESDRLNFPCRTALMNVVGEALNGPSSSSLTVRAT